MNILFLTPAPPHPPDQGTAIRNWGLIAGLAQHHQVTLLTFASPDTPLSEQLRSTCVRIETMPLPTRTTAERLRTLLFSTRPDLADRLTSPAFAARLRDLLAEEQFDVIHIEGLELAPYLHAIRNTQYATCKPTLIYDAHNAETVIQRRAFETDVRQLRRWPAALYSLLQLPRLKRFERAVCSGADHVLCVSREDAAVLRRLAPGLQPVLVPNGLFIDDYTPPDASAPQPLSSPNLQSPMPNLQYSILPCYLVFTGKMDYRPNVDAVQWFADEVFPLVRAEHGAAQFVVVGKQPTPSIRRLGQRDGVQVTGAVDDVRPYIAGATVYVAPLRMGGGTRFKLLEAFALRRAVVSTTIGAEGFDIRSGRELMLADAPREQAQAILELLQNEKRRAALGAAGRAFVEANYDWGTILPVVEELYQRTSVRNAGR